MKKISVFNHITVDGYFAGPRGEIDWFKDIPHDKAYQQYMQKQSQAKSTLLFGRTTYDMMKSFWPTEMAMEMDPKMADVMNNSSKIVFSKSMKEVPDSPHWKNVSVMREISKRSIDKLKRESQEDITILGSGSVVQQLTDLKMISSYTLVIVPVILGKGKPLFKDVKELKLILTSSKAFNNGLVIQHYSREE
jgi:dihydrofolate reductase